MSNGTGRGRGWLKLAKSNAPLPRPGEGSCIATVPNNCSPSLQPNETNAYCDPPTPDSVEFIKRISQLNLMDDGILFNQKIKSILEYWMHECKTKEDVEHSFEQLYNACLLNSDLASKLIVMVASRTFMQQEVSCQNIRRLFLMNLQKNFEEGAILQNKNPTMFRNSVLMIGEFFNKARLANGEPYNFLSTPFIASLKALLELKSSPELMLFTTQLYLNGSTLMTLQPDETKGLLVKVRTILATEPQLSKECKLWLLLAMDVGNQRFAILPPDVFKFYEEQLGSTAIANFQRPHDLLSVQTVQGGNILDSYQSNISVLQISTPPTDNLKNDTTQQQQFATSPPPVVYNSAPQTTPQNDYHQTNMGGSKEKERTEKAGRPILGAGARMHKNRGGGDDGSGGSAWKGHGRENSSGWNSKHKNTSGSGWDMGNKKDPPALKTNKGWEHDDRFDTDYN